MRYAKSVTSVFVLMFAIAVCMAHAGEKNAPPSEKIPKGAKVFIGPIADGYESYLKEAIDKKKVPVEVVASKDQADYEITGTSESQKASTAKKVIMGNWHSRDEASITLSNVKSGVVVWAYAVHQEASVHGKRSSAESCAKHLKDAIEGQ
jgi:hypothetical protein